MVSDEKPAGAEFTWSLTDHVCRACLGRVLMRRSVDGVRHYRCANCAIEQVGKSPSVLCCCGITFGRARRDAGIRCVRNPKWTPECMSEIVAVQAVTGGKPAPSPVDDDDE